MRARGFIAGALAVLTALVLLFPSAGRAAKQESIQSFESRIAVQENGLVEVTETITAYSLGRKIKRGIYRDIPTRYKDRLGNRITIDFQIQEVLRDGKPEPWHTEEINGGRRIYIGRENVLLPPGSHTFTIRYLVPRQIGFFPEYDELYWNVTGNGWAMPIDKASAVVVLPEGTNPLRYVAYTGMRGATGQDYKVRVQGNQVRFRTTSSLAPGEGLTVAVAFPKEVVPRPTDMQRLQWFLIDNMALLAAAGGFVLVLGYYLFAWFIVGRDPEVGTIVPLFNPPKNFSPAAVRFVRRMGFDGKAFSASLVNMAVKGGLTISKTGDDWVLTRTTAPTSMLTPGESKVLRVLFEDGDVLALNRRNTATVKAARKVLKESLSQEFGKANFAANTICLLPGVLLTLLALAAAVWSIGPDAIGLALWLLIWTVGTTSLGAKAMRSWSVSKPQFFLSLIFFLIMTGGLLFGLWAFSLEMGLPAAALLVATMALNAPFYFLLKAPTSQGRMVMDRIEGFRMYLATAEKERLNVLNPPEETPELFERYLPYALALDVENRWCERFASVLSAAGDDQYRPIWYHGPAFGRSGSSFSRALGSSLAGAVLVASAPGSSSGSGGGGFSGGGGGGGGGGGW